MPDISSSLSPSSSLSSPSTSVYSSSGSSITMRSRMLSSMFADTVAQSARLRPSQCRAPPGRDRVVARSSVGICPTTPSRTSLSAPSVPAHTPSLNALAPTKQHLGYEPFFPPLHAPGNRSLSFICQNGGCQKLSRTGQDWSLTALTESTCAVRPCMTDTENDATVGTFDSSVGDATRPCKQWSLPAYQAWSDTGSRALSFSSRRRVRCSVLCARCARASRCPRRRAAAAVRSWKVTGGST
ncbi:hypothetical protein EDB86DRAFT_166099 [Lactarius hatsudake]|nr:hypothetical protein EDB86DRAFT_166099 [Lactarius hatsudake]